MSDADDLVLLHGRLVEGELDDAGRVRLQGLLADAAMRQRFARLMQVDGGLCEAFRARSAPRAAPVRRRPAQRRSKPTWLPALAASLLIGSALVVWFARAPAPAPAAEVPLAQWSDEPTRPPPTTAAPGIAGPGRLRLMDGSCLELDAGCSASLAGDGGVSLHHGRLRATVVPQAPDRRLVVRTSQAEVRVLGTVFTVLVDAAGTEVGVERGRVEVAPAQRPAQRLDGGTAILVPPQGALQPAPPPAWSIDLTDAARRSGWTGILRPDGLLVAHDADISRQFSIPTWNLQMPDPGALGIAAFDAAAELRWEVSLERRAEVAINLQTWSRDGVTWMGTVQRQEALGPGRHRLTWPLRSFAPKQGALPAAMQGLPIRRLILVVWDGEAGVMAHRFAVGRPPAE